MVKARFLFALLALVFCLAGGSHVQAADQAQELLGQASASLKADQPKKALQQTEAALEAIWQKVPLYIEKAIYLKTRPQAYGIYNQRQNHNYPRKGEPVLIYLEPKGYRVKSNPDGTKTFGVSLDIALTDPKGKVLWGKENFLRKEMTSHHFIREFYLLVTLTVSGAPTGDYFVSLRVNDLKGGQSTKVKLPLKLR
jgi:hypothetical protein